MATVTHRSTVAATTNNSAVVTASFTPTAGDLLVAISYHTGKATDPTISVSANGITFTKVTNVLKATSADIMTLWVADQLVPASPAAMTVTTTPGSSSGGAISALSVSGMSRTGTSAVRLFGSQANQAAATPAVAMGGTTVVGNPIIGAIFNATNPATMTQPAGYAENIDTGYATPTTGVEVASLGNPGSGITTLTWGGASGSAFCSVAAEFDLSAAPAPPRPVRQATSIAARSAATARARGF